MSPSSDRLPRLSVVDRAQYLVDAVRDRSMLSIGLGGFAAQTDYSFAFDSTDLASTISGRLASAASSAAFGDLSVDAIDAFQGRVDARYFHLDVTGPREGWPPELVRERFDVVIIGEVLEHLDNPGAALRNLHPLVADGGCLIITVPNCFSLPGLVRAVIGRETTHPEHTSHYSYRTLRRLLSMNALPEAELLWYRWARFGGRRAARIKRAAAASISRALPQLSHGLIAVVPGG